MAKQNEQQSQESERARVEIEDLELSEERSADVKGGAEPISSGKRPKPLSVDGVDGQHNETLLRS